MMKKTLTKNLTAKLIKPQEYLSRYLPNPDEVCGSNNLNLYTHMMLDPRIVSLINLVKTQSLSFPLRLIRGRSLPEVFEVCRQAGFETKYYDDMEQLLSCLIYGYSVSECIWTYKEHRWYLEAIEAKNPSRFVFNSDCEPLWQNESQEIVLNHPYKWILMRYGAAIENPYGESLLKACYWPWKFKQAGLEFWLKATEKFSVPSILALFETQGTEEEIQKRAQNLADMLGSLTSGSGAALANVKQVESLQASGALSDFRALCEFCDQQISYAITGQSLATGDSQYNARAASETHHNVLHQQAKNIAKQLQTVIQQVLDWFVALNFGSNVFSPRVQFDFGEEEKPLLQDMLQVIDRQIPVDMESFYHSYGIVPPQKDRKN